MKIFGETANELGKKSGFIKRERKINGSNFAKAIVFGFCGNPKQSYSEMSQNYIAAGVEISNQGIEQRMTKEAADFLYELLNEVIQESVCGEERNIPLLQRFNGVYLRDSSVVSLPKEIRSVWPGTGGTAGETASVKLQVSINYNTGELFGPVLHPGRKHDQESPFHTKEHTKGALRLADLGFFDLKQMDIDNENGIYWLNRLKTGTVIYDNKGNRIDLLSWLKKLPKNKTETDIFLGANHKIPCRLFVCRVSKDVVKQRRKRLKEEERKRQRKLSAQSYELIHWTLLVTNVPQNLLSFQEAQNLLRLRWQIELLFKLWKSHAFIDEWHTQNPWRILCELYAKLIGVIIFHWIQAIGIWNNPYHSIFKADKVIRKFAIFFIFSINNKMFLNSMLSSICDCFKCGCNLNSRSAKPNTCQLLLFDP